MPLSRINSASIANSAISAADIADGTITAAKIISVANTQITGNIVSSQITSVANTQLTGTITGSQISSNTLSNTVFQTGAVENYLNSQSLALGGMRNHFINGSMVHAQRGTITGAGIDTYGACDRWKHWAADGGESGRCTMSQSTDVPADQNFKYSNKLQVTTAQTSIGSAHAYKLVQRVETSNAFDLGFGSAGKYITVSFWAKVENIPGTYCVSYWLYGASSNKTIVREVSLTTSWTKYTITIPVDSTQQVTTGTGTGIEFGLGLMAGSSVRSGSTASDWVTGSTASTFTTNQANFYSSTSNALYFTGAQLEPGAIATPFEHRHFTTELQLCQRYYWTGTSTQIAGYYGTDLNYSPYYGAGGNFPVTMRAAPSMSFTGGSIPNAVSVALNTSAHAFSHTINGGGSGTVAGVTGATYKADAEI